MQKSKARTEKSKSVSTINSRTIRCGANLLPIKGLIFAMAYAMINDHVSNSKSKEVAGAMQRVSKYLKELMSLANQLQTHGEVSSTTLYAALKQAVLAYVALFYALEHSSRNSYLETANGPSKKIKHEENLLLIPALMASRGENKADVSAYLTRNMYKVPFRVLFHSSKAAMHIELLEQAMGIKAAPDHLMRRFSSLLDRMERKMKEIEDGKISPEDDEMLKQMFIDEAIRLSNTADMKIAEFINERVMPNAFSHKVAHRMQRR